MEETDIIEKVYFGSGHRGRKSRNMSSGDYTIDETAAAIALVNASEVKPTKIRVQNMSPTSNDPDYDNKLIIDERTSGGARYPGSSRDTSLRLKLSGSNAVILPSEGRDSYSQVD